MRPTLSLLLPPLALSALACLPLVAAEASAGRPASHQAAPVAPAAPADPVIRAHIVTTRGEYRGDEVYICHPDYREHNFAACFEGIALGKLKPNSDGGVFGAPVWMLAFTEKSMYILTINNVHGVISIRRARSIARGRYIVVGKERGVHHPVLYDRLREAGVNILSEEELKRVMRLPREEREPFFRPCREPALTITPTTP